MTKVKKKSVYLDADTVDLLKDELSKGFTYRGIRLGTMSQLITALVRLNEEREAIEK